MKRRISATIDPETETLLDVLMKTGRYRNYSHAIEEAIKFFTKEVKNGKNKG